MASRCQFCASLTIERLVELAEQEFSAHYFPRQAFYKHHASFDELEESAMKGCDFCTIVIDCFKGYGSIDVIGAYPFSRYERTWLGRDCDINSSMYDEAKGLDISDVKVCINADHLGSSDTVTNVQVFDIVMVQVGDALSWNSELTSEVDETLPALSLTLSSQRGMSTGSDPSVSTVCSSIYARQGSTHSNTTLSNQYRWR